MWVGGMGKKGRWGSASMRQMERRVTSAVVHLALQGRTCLAAVTAEQQQQPQACRYNDTTHKICNLKITIFLERERVCLEAPSVDRKHLRSRGVN